MKRRFFSLLLSFVLLLSLVGPSTTAYADGTTDSSDNSGMIINKTANYNKKEGTYTIKLEAYATGAVINSLVKEDKPTDIILVLDQSGSMADPFGTTSYEPYSGNYTKNKTLFTYRHNGGESNLWYQLADGQYASVSVVKNTYRQLGSLVNNKTDRRGSITEEGYYYYAYNLYEKVGDKYEQVTLTRSTNTNWDGYWPTYTYTYTFSDGTTVVSDSDEKRPDLGNHAPLYTVGDDNAQTVYTYTYTDENGNRQIIGEPSTGANTKFQPTLYNQTVSSYGGGQRIAAIKTAAKTFVDAVAEKAAGPDGDLTTVSDNVNHRIAVVGFASESEDGDNTELLSIEGTNSGNVGVAYNSINDDNLEKVLQNMNESKGQELVNKAIEALQAEGATRTDLGLNMARRILEKNPVDANKDKNGRNRFVVVFTDGSPTDSRGFQTSVANAANGEATTIKKTQKATIYSVGIFAGANASSAGKNPNAGNVSLMNASNWFMQNISSNDGKPQHPSYYLSAADADTLKRIFAQIAHEVPSGGSATKLDDKAVVKDIISPYFKLPDGATTTDIKLKTASYIGEDMWGEEKYADQAVTAQIDGKEVKVTGFNFSDNWCGPERKTDGSKVYHGEKLIISFDVVPEPKFLGGNGVPTNDHAGVYENDRSQESLFPFKRPEVDVDIKDITISAPEKNVYLLQNIPGIDIKSGITAQVGNVELDLDAGAPNYGLEDWQKEFVTIDVKIKDVDGTEIGNDLAGLSDDSKYTVSITVSPKKTEGAAKVSTNNGEGKINVFKPELTFKDSEAYYGEKVTEDFSSSNKSGESWKHGEGEKAVKDDDTGITMIGNRPVLDIGYTPNDGMLDVKTDVKYYTKKDVPVKATVKIGAVDVTENTGFVHECDSNNCDWQNPTTKGDPAFKIHVKTCQLTITKSGGAIGEPYVFTVKRNGNDYSEVTVGANESATIYELPVGTYTIEEDTGWSWRYAPSNIESATLSAPTEANSQSYMGTITCTNTKTNNKWLNGFSSVVQNIYNRANN